MNMLKRYKNWRTVLLFILLVFPIATAVFPQQKAYAYQSPGELSLDQQKTRPLLYAFGYCISQIGFKTGISADDINNKKILLDTSQNNLVEIGYEADPGDGRIACNNATEEPMMISNALSHVGMTYDQLWKMLYQKNTNNTVVNGDTPEYILKDGAQDTVDKLLQQKNENHYVITKVLLWVRQREHVEYLFPLRNVFSLQELGRIVQIL